VAHLFIRVRTYGVTGPNGPVYSDRDAACAPVVFYNRCNEAAARSSRATSIGRESSPVGLRWFHSGGIFAALSETTAELMIEGMRAAKELEPTFRSISNFREKLWRIFRRTGARSVSVLNRIVQHVDVLVGNEEDLQKGLAFLDRRPPRNPNSIRNAFFE